VIEATGTLQVQAWHDQVLPPVERVRPGLWSIPVPIPDNPLRYVLVYALEVPAGVALIDAGWDTDDAWAALTDGLGRAGYGPGDVTDVFVTHIHPDHYGLAGRIRDASGARVALHPADAALVGDRYADMGPLLAKARGMLLDGGVPAATAADLGAASVGVSHFVSPVAPDVLIDDGDRLDLPGWNLRALWTPGHSPGHLCFYDADRRLLLSGDHLLPRISPNISVHPQQRPNPLADFLDSLDRLRHLDVDEVLPAHEYRFRRCAHRAAQLAAHHHARLEEIEAAVRHRPGATAWELTLGLGWSRPWDQLSPLMQRAAFGETMAHLVLLQHQGRLRRQAGPPQRWQPTR
jgi:glyoxylase-like metal-dependent hydrolase (beta-lactamase superfamily II)